MSAGTSCAYAARAPSNSAMAIVGRNFIQSLL
jgi:hypothetical protein